jgi:hypothetical protein
VPFAAGVLTVSCLCAAVLLLTVHPVAVPHVATQRVDRAAGNAVRNADGTAEVVAVPATTVERTEVGAGTEVRAGAGLEAGDRTGDGAGAGEGVRARGRFVDDLRAGVRVIVVSRPLRAVTAATCVAMFGQGMMPSIAVLLGVAHGRPAGGGVLVAAIGVGALSGSLLMARRPVAVAPHRLALVCLVGMGAVLGVAAFVHNWVVLVALFAVAGLFDGPLLTSVLQVRSDAAPARARTQVFTLGAGFKLTAAAVGAASFAVVAGWPLWVLVVGVGGAQVAAAAVGVLLLAGRRA